MSSSIAAGLFGLAGVVLGGSMTMVTTWWQTVNARKGRLAELEIQLRHERFLRDETVRRSAMLELIYTLERFSNAATEAFRAHEHGKDFSSQTESPTTSKLVTLGQASVDLLFKNASLMDGETREALEHVRDNWDELYTQKGHPYPYGGKPDIECCPPRERSRNNGGDNKQRSICLGGQARRYARRMSAVTAIPNAENTSRAASRPTLTGDRPRLGPIRRRASRGRLRSPQRRRGLTANRREAGHAAETERSRERENTRAYRHDSR
jgi:hypothetical protein